MRFIPLDKAFSRGMTRYVHVALYISTETLCRRGVLDKSGAVVAVNKLVKGLLNVVK